jgi:hypothetical protein
MLQLLHRMLFEEKGQSYGYISVGTILTIILVVVLLMILL